MRLGWVWREWESGDSLPLSVLRIAVLFCGIAFLAFTAVLGLPWPQQALIAVLTVPVAIWLDRASSSYVVTLTLMLLSVYSTFRYAYWRINTTAGAVREAGSLSSIIDAGFMLLLLAAESYAVTVLLLGYMQMVWPLRRTPVALPDSIADWPEVDVLIPTYNEPLDVVRFTVLAALNMDWPAEKLKVYVLDDGRREEFREFAQHAGAGYITRDYNQDGKAGNLNAALERIDSPFLVVFDADHVPTRSFLQVTMGWFLRDAQLGILQTPNHFYSPDPFERNLGQFRSIPTEDELFYGVVQDGNDFWNATYFCGSCAVLRRTALDQAGGLATDTVTQDAHTSMRMQRLGWNSAYINIPQAAGLATETLSAHVRQRIRWARGMVQILRVENPMFGSGLTFAQRLCYLNAMSHFLYALPRLIFLTAPLMYLIFGYTNIPGYWAAILGYAVPHLVLSRIARSRMQGTHRHSFWTEIFETVLAPHLVFPTLSALLWPGRGRLHGAQKGETVDTNYFDSHVARPTLILLACNWFGLCCAVPHLLQFPSWQVPAWAAFVNWPAALYDPRHAGLVTVNAVWAIFNLVLLGVALAVARESQQRRRSVRVETQVPSEALLEDGSIVRGVTADLSSGGVRITMDYDVKAAPGERVQFTFPVLDGTAMLPGTVVSMRGRTLRATFDNLTLEQYEALTLILYARADRWLGWGKTREPDRPLRSFVRVLRLAARGLRHAVFGQGWRDEEPGRRSWAAGTVPVLIFSLLLSSGGRSARGAGLADPQAGRRAVDPLVVLAPATPAKAQPAKTVVAPAGFQRSFTLAQAGVRETIALRGAASRKSVAFQLPQGALVNSGVLKLRYQFSPRLLAGISSLRVSLNGTSVATFPVLAPPKGHAGGEEALSRRQPQPGSKLSDVLEGERAPVLESTVALPPDLLGRANELGFEFTGHYAGTCEDPTDPALWSHVDPGSTVEVAGSIIPLQDDLGLLPMPFYQPGLSGEQTVQIAFLKQPSHDAMRAVGILASWFGAAGDSRPVRFRVSMGRIPAGNVVVIAEGRAGVPQGLGLAELGPGANAMVRTNPADANGKVLVLVGSEGGELARAVTAIASQREPLQGAQAQFAATAHERVKSAPRWLSTESTRTFANAETVDLDGDGSQTATAYLRLPPDLYFGRSAFSADASAAPGTAQRSVPLHVIYRYNGVPLGEGSELQMWVNGEFVRSTALPHTDRKATTAETVVPLSAAALRPFSNTLSFRFVFVPAKSAGCAVAGSTDFRGSILKESYLDVEGTPHWTELPNLELFANAGYPFTRDADLGNTTVIVPDEPTGEELELYLAMMGHFGAQTGTAATGVNIAGPDAVNAPKGKDLLVLGSLSDQPVVRNAALRLPFTVDDAGVHLSQAENLTGRQHPWWKVGSGDGGRTRPGPQMPDALLESVEWPIGSERAMVVVAVRDDSAAARFTSAFLSNSQSSAMEHSAALLDGGAFASFATRGRVFLSGRLPLVERLSLALAPFPWLIAIASVMFCFLMASLLRTALRRSARVRLQGNY